MMKKWLSFILTLTLLCGIATFSPAESPSVYQLGDKMDDFSATLSDGTEVSLYGLLAEKKAVLLNFWASWCSPCKMEFPFMEQAYNEMSDEIGIIALSCEPADTDEVVLSLKEELGLSQLPMGLDRGLADRFAVDGFPTSVLVDRNGVICFIEVGSIPSKDQFVRLFSAYTAEDYSQPLILSKIPDAVPDVEFPPAEAIRDALRITDDGIEITAVSDSTVWPFIPSADGGFAEASNGAVLDSKAVWAANVSAQAGEALGFGYAVSCAAVYDSLTVSVDGAIVKYYSGSVDWTDDFVPFETAGVHAVEIVFEHGAMSPESKTSAFLRDLRILSAEEAAALEALKPSMPKALSGMECEIEPLEGNIKPILVTEVMPDSGESTDTMGIVTGETLTLRVKIGADVDAEMAFVTDGILAYMLTSLPRDEIGYLYQVTIPSTELAYQTFGVYSSAIDINDLTSTSYTCFASEAGVDTFVAMYSELAKAYGFEDYEIHWEYADGSPKQATGTEKEAPLADGTAKYVISVQDETGAPIAGAMVQICDASTCQVAVTDADGLATLTTTRYPYEIHLLKAPDGYAPNTETYVLPEEGGEVVIPLQKQD